MNDVLHTITTTTKTEKHTQNSGNTELNPSSIIQMPLIAQMSFQTEPKIALLYLIRCVLILVNLIFLALKFSTNVYISKLVQQHIMYSMFDNFD